MPATQSGGRSGTIVAAVLLTVMVAGIVYRYWPSDEREIRRHLSNLAEALSTPGGETDVEHLTRVAALREYFAPEIQVKVVGEQTLSRDALIGIISRLAAPAGGFAVEFVDITVTLAQDHRSADVTLTARVASTNPQTAESTVDTRAAAGTMRKMDGDWVITAVDSPDSQPPR